MPNPENIEPYKWKKGQSGNPKGRPKKVVSKFVERGYKIVEVNDTLQALMALELNEIKQVYQDEKATVLERIVAKALFEALKKGDLKNVETLLSRVFGQPKQSVDATISAQPLFGPEVNRIEDQEE